MSRVKFKVWHKKEERWADYQVMLPSGRTGPVATNGQVLAQPDRDAIVCLSTGLFDARGHEIYEGDILRSRENDEVYKVDDFFPVHRHTHITNVGYFTGKKYHSRTASAAYDNLDDWMSWPEMYEVIGNVFENSELLSAKK